MVLWFRGANFDEMEKFSWFAGGSGDLVSKE
jgi:hypothetical protein